MKPFLCIHLNMITSVKNADGPKCVLRKMNDLPTGENKHIIINDGEIDYIGEGMTVTEQQELPA